MSLRRTLVAAAAAVVLAPSTVRAYPIDCAILLCLAGGWPPVAECAAAKAEVIRRITPWPIEPPLQLWRCPMGAAVQDDERPSERLYRVAGSLVETPVLDHVQADPTLDFIGALRVYHIRFSEIWWEKTGSCHSMDATRVGLYDERGDFHWRRFDAEALPDWAPRPDRCAAKHAWRLVRAVAVGWQAHDGTPGHEIIHY